MHPLLDPISRMIQLVRNRYLAKREALQRERVRWRLLRRRFVNYSWWVSLPVEAKSRLLAWFHCFYTTLADPILQTNAVRAFWCSHKVPFFLCTGYQLDFMLNCLPVFSFPSACFQGKVFNCTGVSVLFPKFLSLTFNIGFLPFSP